MVNQNLSILFAFFSKKKLLSPSSASGTSAMAMYLPEVPASREVGAKVMIWTMCHPYGLIACSLSNMVEIRKAWDRL